MWLNKRSEKLRPKMLVFVYVIASFAVVFVKQMYEAHGVLFTAKDFEFNIALTMTVSLLRSR